MYGDNGKYIKIKIKIHDNNINTNFHGKKVQKENTSCKYLSLIMLDSALLEESKYEIKNTKMENFINDELEPSSSDDESDSDSDDEPERPSKKFDNEPSNEIDKKSDNE